MQFFRPRYKIPPSLAPFGAPIWPFEMVPIPASGRTLIQLATSARGLTAIAIKGVQHPGNSICAFRACVNRSSQPKARQRPFLGLGDE